MKPVISQKTRKDLEALKLELRALRDEINLKVHLAGMDLKDEWARLEPQAEKAFKELSATTYEAARDLKARFQKMREQLKN
ncbi:MAG: hypothetical protein IT380_20100 [Myxococcales bacterium]|nr:hypothetical protein [Myxococcales bacterium]